jgi:glycerophosphoryl diester phosphodiesterase
LFALSYEELKRYDVGRLKPGTAYAARHPEQRPEDGARIPRLADVFALAEKSGNREVRFNIETKLNPDRPASTPLPEPFAEAVVRVIREANMQKRATIQSFDWRTLKVVQRIAPEIPTVALTTQRSATDDNIQAGRRGPSPWLAGLDVDDFGGSVPRLVKAGGAAVWSPNHLDLDARGVDEAHALGLSVIPWTINEPADMERILGWGVDGIISDYPDRLRSVLAAKGIPLPKPTPVR